MIFVINSNYKYYCMMIFKTYFSFSLSYMSSTKKTLTNPPVTREQSQPQTNKD